MEDTRKDLYSKASDLWYTLREDYSSPELMLSDFITYVRLEVALLKTLSITERADTAQPITNDDKNGANIAYAIINTISAIKEDVPTYATNEIKELLWVVVDAFSYPHMDAYWETFYRFVEKMELQKHTS